MCMSPLEESKTHLLWLPAYDLKNATHYSPIHIFDTPLPLCVLLSDQCCPLCVCVQYCGAGPGRGRRPVRTSHIPSVAHPEAGALHARTALPAGHHATYHGQCGHLLCPPCPLHLHLQVVLSQLKHNKLQMKHFVSYIWLSVELFCLVFYLFSLSINHKGGIL